MTVRQTVENGRAAFAFKKVKTMVEQHAHDERFLKEYRSYIKKMPAMVQVNGLGQTLAFYYSKNGAYKQIYHDLAVWVSASMEGLINQYRQEGNQEFIEILVNMPSGDYRLVTMEILAILNWMRRFADGMIQGD